MNDIRAVVIRGDFTDAELTEIVALLRKIDERRPDVEFEISVEATDAALKPMEQLFRETFPSMPGRRTELFRRAVTVEASGRGDSDG